MRESGKERLIPNPTDTVFCTIAACNYTAHVMTLAESIQYHHQGSSIYVLIVDRDRPHTEWPVSGLKRIELKDLELPQEHHCTFKYNMVEFCTAVKARFLAHVFSIETCKRVLFLDPDIRLYGALDSVIDEMSRSSIALTPHLLDGNSSKQGLRHDFLPLRAGIFNLGFIGLTRGEASAKFLKWWDAHLMQSCFNDRPRGLFVDQKWLDFAPVYFEGVCILRDPTLNVARWNLHERRVARKGGTYVINEMPLTFFHFSQSRTSRFFDVSTTVRQLVDEYHGRLSHFGVEQFHDQPYSFNFFDSGAPVEPFHRKTLDRMLQRGGIAASPFSRAGKRQIESESSFRDRLKVVIPLFWRTRFRKALRWAFSKLSPVR